MFESYNIVDFSYLDISNDDVYNKEKCHKNSKAFNKHQQWCMP